MFVAREVWSLPCFPYLPSLQDFVDVGVVQMPNFFGSILIEARAAPMYQLLAGAPANFPGFWKSASQFKHSVHTTARVSFTH